jgi:hypothetical protein
LGAELFSPGYSGKIGKTAAGSRGFAMTNPRATGEPLQALYGHRKHEGKWNSGGDLDGWWGGRQKK